MKNIIKFWFSSKDHCIHFMTTLGLRCIVYKIIQVSQNIMMAMTYCRSPFFRGHHIFAVGIQSAKISWLPFRKLLYYVYIFISYKPSMRFSTTKISIRDLRKITQPRKKATAVKMAIYSLISLLILESSSRYRDISTTQRIHFSLIDKNKMIPPFFYMILLLHAMNWPL